MSDPAHPLKETASQTAGPFVHIGLAPLDAGVDVYASELGREIAGPDVQGQRITVTGSVFDGTGAPISDVLIEVWQADADGTYSGAYDTPRALSDGGAWCLTSRPAFSALQRSNPVPWHSPTAAGWPHT